MEALAALGVAAAAVQFYAFAADFCPKLAELVKSPTGDLEVNKSLEDHARRIKQLCDGTSLPRPADQHTSPDHIIDLAMQARLQSLHQQCVTISDLMLLELDNLRVKVKPDGSRSVRSAFTVAFKSTTTPRKLVSLQSRLNALQHDINTHLLADINQMVQKTHEEAAQKADSMLASLQNILDTLTRTSTTTSQLSSLNQSISDHIEKRFEQAETGAANLSGRTRFLDSLWFEEIFLRQEDIQPAHGTTFQWLLDSQSNSGDENLRQVENSLKPWLRGLNTSSAYWIQGVPGSGKSTLLSVMIDHKDLDQHLHVWSGGARVLKASFFIWKSGTAVQMQHNSIYRALAHQLLNSEPTLFKVVQRGARGRYGQNFDAIPAWNTRSLQELLFALVSASSHVFLVLDGLDEAQESHSDLLEFLQALWKLPQVKICMSSRSEPIFSEELEMFPGLRLHDLTKHDIREFIVGRLRVKWADRDAINDLTATIIDRADGVFLWVKLVVDRVNKGSADGDTTAELKRKVLETPSGLKLLYTTLLRDLDVDDKVLAGTFFGMVDRWNQLHETLPFEDDRTARKRLGDDKGIPVLLLSDAILGEDSILPKAHSTCVHEHPKDTIMRLRARVQSRCKGLLELTAWEPLAMATYPTQDESRGKEGGRSAWSNDVPGGYARFIHRTARDHIFDATPRQSSIPLASSQYLDACMLRGYTSVFQYCSHLSESALWRRWLTRASLIAFMRHEYDLDEKQSMLSLADEIISWCSEMEEILQKGVDKSHNDIITHIYKVVLDEACRKRRRDRLVLALAAASSLWQTLEENTTTWNDAEVVSFIQSKSFGWLSLFQDSFHSWRGFHFTSPRVKHPRGRMDGFRVTCYFMKRLLTAEVCVAAETPARISMFFFDQLSKVFHQRIPSLMPSCQDFTHGETIARPCTETSIQGQMLWACNAFVPLLRGFDGHERYLFTHVLYYPPIDVDGKVVVITAEFDLSLLDQICFVSPGYPYASELLRLFRGESEGSPRICRCRLRASLPTPEFDRKLKWVVPQCDSDLLADLLMDIARAPTPERESMICHFHEEVRKIAVRMFRQPYSDPDTWYGQVVGRRRPWMYEI